MALTREQKIGLASLGVGVVGLYLYKKSQTQKATASTAVPVSTQGSIAASTPQQPEILDPGQTVYDPNTGNFLTTPSGQTKTPSGPSYIINVVYPKHTPGKRPDRHHHHPGPVYNPPHHKPPGFGGHHLGGGSVSYHHHRHHRGGKVKK